VNSQYGGADTRRRAVRAPGWLWLAAAVAMGGCGNGSAAGRDTSDPDSTLRVMAETLLPEVETLAGLQARRPLALAVRTRDELEAFLTTELGRQRAWTPSSSSRFSRTRSCTRCRTSTRTWTR